MMTDRQIQEIVARCVSTLVFYHNSERSREADEQMAAEVQVIAGFVKELGLDVADVDKRIIRPVEFELIDRYGHEVTPRLFGEFIGAFESMGVVDGRRREIGVPMGRAVGRW
jgi:hypothetical protein